MGCSYQSCLNGAKVLVCHYGSRGLALYGNTIGEFQANVLPTTPAGPGPRNQRAWDSVIDTAKAAYVAESYLPTQIQLLLSDSISEDIFQSTTTVSTLATNEDAENIPLAQPLPPAPPSPPTLSPPSPPPYPPFDMVEQAQNVGSGSSDEEDLGWVYGLVLGIFIPLLLCCCLCCILYRMSGGEPGLWAKVHYTHSNQKVSFCYATDDQRRQAAEDMALCQRAMADSMVTYSSSITGYWCMRRDHVNFIKAGGLKTGRAAINYTVPYDEKGAEVPASAVEPQKAEEPTALAAVIAAEVASAPASAPAMAPAPAPEAAPVKEAPDRALPDEPCIDADLDAEFTESPEDRVRRLEWIKYFVREGDLQRAFDLGWDGKPFRQAVAFGSAARLQTNPPTSPAPDPAPSPSNASDVSKAEGKKPMSSAPAPTDASTEGEAGPSSSDLPNPIDSSALAPTDASTEGEAGPSSSVTLHRI
jgi:hypothetical protein